MAPESRRRSPRGFEEGSRPPEAAPGSPLGASKRSPRGVDAANRITDSQVGQPPSPSAPPSSSSPRRARRDLDFQLAPRKAQASQADELPETGATAVPVEEVLQHAASIDLPPPRIHFGRGWKVALFFVVILGLAGAFVGPGAYRHLKTWRARKMVVEAQGLLKEKKLAEALEKARVAYQLSPMDDTTLRLAASITAAQGQRDAIVFWKNLLDTGKATSQDRIDLGTFALIAGDLETVAEQVKSLLKSDPERLDVLRLAAGLHANRGEMPEARAFGRRALQVAPKDGAVQFFLARLLVKSPLVAEQFEARRLLRGLAAGTNAPALEALSMMARLPDLPRDDADLTAARLLAHPLARTQERLMAAELRIRWRPDQRGAVVASALAEYRNGNDEDLAQLGRWLNRLREYTATTNALPRARAFKAQDLLMLRLDAMASLGAWKEIEAELAIKPNPFDPVLVDLFAARTAHELGMLDKAAQAWRRVHLGAAENPAAWLYIAQYAERVGEAGEAAKAWKRLVTHPDLGRTAYEALIRLYEKEGNTRALREVMRELCHAFPEEMEQRNDLAYLDLLLGENMADARAASERLAKEYPSFLSFRTTLALARLRAKEPEKANALYEGVNLDWGAVMPGWQAVRVAVLAANGKTNLARVAAKRIPMDRLKPEEKALIQPVL